MNMSAKFCDQAMVEMTLDSIFLYVITGVIGIITNSTVVLLICKTRQLKNQSIRLLMYLSYVDIFTSSVLIFRVFTGSEGTCYRTSIYYYVWISSTYLSLYLFQLTVIDRYLRIKYLEEYPNVFTKSRFHSVIGFYLFTSIVHAIVVGVLNTTNYIGYAFKFSFPVNALGFITIFIFYFLSILKLKEYQRMNRNISEATKGIVRITKVHLYLFVSKIVVLIGTQGLMRTMSDGILLETIRRGIVVWPSIVGTINAIVFIIINPPSREISSLEFNVIGDVVIQVLQSTQTLN